jgi:hypothetical protein
MTADDPVRIAITRDEALVLHEWLSRVVDDENARPIADAFDHDGEAWALAALLAVLERALPEPYEPGFEKRLRAARDRIAAANGPWPTEG